jgi:hypothetical protein
MHKTTLNKQEFILSVTYLMKLCFCVLTASAYMYIAAIRMKACSTAAYVCTNGITKSEFDKVQSDYHGVNKCDYST